MVGFEMFCERCGKRYGNGEASHSTSLPLSKRLLKAVGVSASAPQAPADEPLLRFCLACRGYSCAECWNDGAGFCQTCVPVEMPFDEQPVINIPALETPTPASPAPQMSFEATDDMPPYLAMLAQQELAAVDPLADFAAPEPETAAVPEPELTVAAEAYEQPAFEAAVEPSPEAHVELVAEPVFAQATDAVADMESETEETYVAAGELVADDEETALAVEEPAVTAQEPVAAVAGAVAAAETLALDERPIELVFADEELVAEPEHEAAWDWSFVSETDAAPVETPEPAAEPIAATAEETEAVESGSLVDAPVVPAQPQILPPPVYRPLPPLGPIVPPPPPIAASPRPTIDFDILEPPPAFVIAPPQAQALMRPQLPAGLFDGPGPQIRPCHQCELPVSAKARFCRRCGSAQEGN